MHGTTSTIQRQASTALLAVVQHIHDRQLGCPVSITTPTQWERFVSLFVEARSLDRWLDEDTSGFVAEHTDIRPLAGRIGGRRNERVLITGHLQPLGLRVRLTAVRPATELLVVPDGATA